MNKNSKATTLVELLAVIAVIMVLISVLLFNIHPLEQTQKARDARRFLDLVALERMVYEYRADNKVYPDLENTTRYSNVLPEGSARLENAVSGWIPVDLSLYTTKSPTDPINSDQYRYSYRQNGVGYEINAVLEINPERMQNDGGNNPSVYELGTDLTLIP